jgi:glutamine synthetase type III
MSKGIADLWSSTNKRISTVAIHYGDANRPDPFAFGKEVEMRTKIYGIAFSGWPNAVLNRNVQTRRGSIIKSVITDLIAVDSNVGLALDSSLKDRTLSLTVKVGFGEDLSSLKLVVYLTENGLKANQRTFGDLEYGEGANGYFMNLFRQKISILKYF